MGRRQQQITLGGVYPPLIPSRSFSMAHTSFLWPSNLTASIEMIEGEKQTCRSALSLWRIESGELVKGPSEGAQR